MRGRTNRLFVSLGAAVAAATLLAGCAHGMGKPNITAKVNESSLTLVPGVAKEGKVKFDIDNGASSGRVLLILRSPDVSKVPVTADGLIDTSKVSIADTVKEFGPGRFRALSPNLAAGSYVVVITTPSTAGPDAKPRYAFNPTQAAKLELKPLS